MLSEDPSCRRKPRMVNTSSCNLDPCGLWAFQGSKKPVEMLRKEVGTV